MCSSSTDEKISVYSGAHFSCSLSFAYDSSDSWEHAQIDGLKVGLVETNSENLRREEAILLDFAREENIPVFFVRGSETELVDQVELYELQVVGGSFSETMVWQQKAALTKPYDGTHVLLVPKGENRLSLKLDSYLVKN